MVGVGTSQNLPKDAMGTRLIGTSSVMYLCKMVFGAIMPSYPRLLSMASKSVRPAAS